jgi:hypothetical protein
MVNTAFIRLPDGSLTEFRLKQALSRKFGGKEHSFYKVVIRMQFNYQNCIRDELIGIFTEISNNESSAKTIAYLQQHDLSIPKESIIGIIHPVEWSKRRLINENLEVVMALSKEYGIPILEPRRQHVL